MHTFKKSGCRVLIIILFSLSGNLTRGQGCSDAGFCTINSFKPNETGSILNGKNQLKFGLSYGSADHSIVVFGNYVEYNRRITDQLGIDAKITTLSQSGNGISVFGLSDLYINANYRFAKNTTLTFGTKIPLMDGNRTKDDLGLPMDYQSSLGTFDLIAGIGYEIKSFQIVAAIQQPLTQNSNSFLADSYPDSSEFKTFQSTNKYIRKGDALLRLSYPVNMGSKLKITPSVLSIYHFTQDKFTDLAGLEQEIIGSEGLTINGNLYFDYLFNEKNALQLNIGTPFLVRESRPDGLTRSIVINFEYQLKF